MDIRPLAGLLAASISMGSARADRAGSLRDNVRSLPDVTVDTDAVVEAALAAETDRIPAELLLAVAWGESRFQPDVRTGRVCGIMQVNPADIGRPRSDCAVWARDLRAAFAAGVTEIETMLRDRRVHGDIERALLYRACGNAAFNGRCHKGRWPGWVLRRSKVLKRGS